MQRAALAAVVDRHLEAQRIGQPPLQRARVGVLAGRLDRPCALRAARRAPGAAPSARMSSSSWRTLQPFVDHLVRDRSALGWPTSSRA